MNRILLVEPDFPIPAKSRNHKNFVPIGLLKIGAYLRDQGHQVKLVRGLPKNQDELQQTNGFDPEEVWITSLFTYWIRQVREAVQYYRAAYPVAHIKVGGICASLLPSEFVKEYTGCDDVHQGVIPEVEEHAKSRSPAYELLGNVNPHPIDFQIIHASRGCLRRCSFCGTWRIEPEFRPKKSISGEVRLPGVVFYDNNFLMNPHVERVLRELVELRREGTLKWVESQSGLDGRALYEKPHLARMMKEAGFRYPRIAWDSGYRQKEYIRRQIDILECAGYESRDISVFMLYNHGISFLEMEQKRISCWEWQVQVADCRFRPLDQLVDDYKSWIVGQPSEDYFMGQGWNDAMVKQFRKNVRRQNICVRMRYPLYSSAAEHRRLDKETLSRLRELKTAEDKAALLEQLGWDCWTPERITPPQHA